jgi:hypothetical protein
MLNNVSRKREQWVARGNPSCRFEDNIVTDATDVDLAHVFRILSGWDTV